jgi:hypothetical protein
LKILSHHAALQKFLCCYANKWIVPGIWHAYVRHNIHRNKGDNQMSKTVSLGFAPSATLFGRLLSAIDRLLMANARIAVRNGDLPYFGL